MKIDFKELGEKHKDIFNNPEIDTIAEWRQANFDEDTDEATYLSDAISNIKNLKEKIKEVIGDL